MNPTVLSSPVTQCDGIALFPVQRDGWEEACGMKARVIAGCLLWVQKLLSWMEGERSNGDNKPQKPICVPLKLREIC